VRSFVLALLGVSRLALADPRLPSPRDAVEKLMSTRLHLTERIAPNDDAHGVDDALERLVTRMSGLLAKVTHVHHGLGGFVRVENLASGPHGNDSAPRIVVVGVRFGVSSTMWAP